MLNVKCEVESVWCEVESVTCGVWNGKCKSTCFGIKRVSIWVRGLQLFFGRTFCGASGGVQYKSVGFKLHRIHLVG